MKQLERIKKKLCELKTMDISFEVFGADRHKYTFSPVLSESEISSFEKADWLTLREDYRLFLKEVGNSGACPFYGLFSLEDNNDQLSNLSEDFPFDLENPCSLVKYEDYDNKMDQAENEDEEQAIWNLKQSLINEEYDNATKGITFLCHEGCCMFNVLILKGKEKGSVWWFNFADNVGTMPIFKDKKQVSFLDWYEIWLDESIEYCKTEKEPFSTYGHYLN